MDGASAFAKSTPALSVASFPTDPASVTYVGGPDFEFDLDKVTPMVWDKRFEEDLFRGVDPSQLNDHVNLCRSVFGCCIAEVGLHIHFKEIIPYMAGRNMLTADEVYQLTDKPVSKSEKALYLTLYILPLKGILLTPISLFYSCLVESAATEDGLQSHYYLAQILRRSVHESIHRKCGILEETRKQEKQDTDVLRVTGKVCRKFPPVDDTTILALIHVLKLSTCEPPVTAKHSIPWIFECWRRLNPECDWTKIVEALVLVPKLGYLVSDLLSPCQSSPPQMCSFVRSLRDDWPSLAEHLGYPRRLVRAIQNHWAGSCHSQIKAFLKYWVFPDCGMTNNYRIVERLRMSLEKEPESPQPQQTATLEKATYMYAGESDFEFDLDKVSPMFWDKKLDEDLFYGVDHSQLTYHRDLCLSVFQRCVREFGQKLQIKEIIPYLCSRNMLTNTELYRLGEKPIPKFEKACYLALVVLPSKGRLLTPISLFYSCLVESAVTEDGLEHHYYLAKKLMECVHEIIHRKCGILQETQEREKQQTDLLQVIGKVCKKFPHADDTTIHALIDLLKLSRCNPPVTADRHISWIFDCWRRLNPECDWTKVVEALVLVPKLGYLVSDLLSPCRSSPPQMCRFVHSLEEDWPSLAEHLGYPQRLVRAIQNYWVGSCHSQIKAFLQYWVFPDCGITNNFRIVDRLKMCLGILHKPIDFETYSSCLDEAEPPVKPKLSVPEPPVPEPPELKPDLFEVDRGEELFAAIQRGDRHVINEVLMQPFNTECKDQDGLTPFLHFCASHGMQEQLELAINAGSDINVTDADINCCLHYEEVIKHSQVMNMLLKVYDKRELKYPVNIINKQGMSPLMVACKVGVRCLDSIQLLLAHGAEPNIESARTPPLIIASKDSCLKIVELLLLYGANVNIRDKMYKTTALIQACTWGHTGVVQLLLEMGATTSLQEMDGTTALTAAVRRNDVGIMKLLIRSYANVNQCSFTGSYGGSEETPLAIACAENFHEAAGMLIEEGARTDYRCSNCTVPIGFAIIRDHLGLVRFMLEHTKPECKTVYALYDAFDVAMAYDKFDAATMILKDAGGLEHVLEEARTVGMMTFIYRLQEYKGLVQSEVIHPDEMKLNCKISIEDENRKSEEILQQFCYLCMKTVTRNSDCETLATFAEGAGRSGAAEFFRTYSVCPMSPRDLKSGLIRGNRESALRFLIEQKALDVKSFQIVAAQMYHAEELEDFYRNLDFAVQTIHGREAIPGDQSDVNLEKLLNGDISLSTSHEESDVHSSARSGPGESSGYHNQSPFEVVDVEKTIMKHRVENQGTTSHVPLPAPTSTGVESLFQRLKIEKHGDGNKTTVPRICSSAMPVLASKQPKTQEPAPMIPAPESKKAHGDGDSSKEPTKRHQPLLPEMTLSRMKAVAKQQEMDSSDQTPAGSTSHLHSSRQETHSPRTSTPVQHAVCKLSAIATPLQQSTAQPSTPHTPSQRHTSGPTSGSTHVDSEIRDEVFNCCPPHITTENSQVATSTPSIGGLLPVPTTLHPINDSSDKAITVTLRDPPVTVSLDTLVGEADVSIPSDFHIKVSTTAAEGPAGHQLVTASNRHQIHRQEGHESKDRADSTKETPPPSFSLLSLQSGRGQFSRKPVPSCQRHADERRGEDAVHHSQLESEVERLRGELRKAEVAIEGYEDMCKDLLKDYTTCTEHLAGISEEYDRTKNQVEIGLRKRIEMADHIKMLEQQHDEALEQIEHMDMQLKLSTRSTN